MLDCGVACDGCWPPPPPPAMPLIFKFWFVGVLLKLAELLFGELLFPGLIEGVVGVFSLPLLLCGC